MLVLSTCRCQEPSDLVAQVLPKLLKPDALMQCWPLLSASAAQSHPKWLQLCVLVMQAAAQQHGFALWLSLPAGDKCGGAAAEHQPVGVHADSLPDAARAACRPQLGAAAAAAVELLQAVKLHVRMSARTPQLVCWTSTPKWSFDGGAAALEAEGFVLGDQGTAAPPPQPELPAGATADAKAAAAAGWQQQTANLAAQVRPIAAGAVTVSRMHVFFPQDTARGFWVSCRCSQQPRLSFTLYNVYMLQCPCHLAACRSAAGLLLYCCCNSGCRCCWGAGGPSTRPGASLQHGPHGLRVCMASLVALLPRQPPSCWHSTSPAPLRLVQMVLNNHLLKPQGHLVVCLRLLCLKQLAPLLPLVGQAVCQAAHLPRLARQGQTAAGLRLHRDARVVLKRQNQGLSNRQMPCCRSWHPS